MAAKDCFGILEKVFPVGENDLREVVAECFQCTEKTTCLKAALSTKEGLDLRRELLDRAAVDRGLLGRLKRWSQRKTLDRLIKREKKKICKQQ